VPDLTRERAAVTISEIDRSTTVDRVVAVLRQAMFDGDLVPGEPLREIPLSQKLRVGRSTIREALRALATDGLVQRLASRGLVVRNLTVAEIDDIFIARHFLECGAAKAAASCPDAALETLRRAFEAYADAADKADASQAAVAHVEFHGAMVALAGSQRLAEAERSMMRDLQLVITTIEKSSDDLPREIEKHRVLLDLFCQRKVREVIAQIEIDLDHSRRFAVRNAADAHGVVF
jgi:DNA-binding GntR family transcriptional regulator